MGLCGEHATAESDRKRLIPLGRRRIDPHHHDVAGREVDETEAGRKMFHSIERRETLTLKD
jgi:hypothetical protein